MVPQNENFRELSLEELNAVLIHKWYLSEKEDRDVGLEYAQQDFLEYHYKNWKKNKLEEEMKLQREEILLHKWFLSEKMGYDIGTTQAALDWVKIGYAEHWRNRTGPYKNRQ